MNQRYLSSAAKKIAELESWEKAKADYLANPPSGFVGGHGYPDPEIFEWCDKINTIEGVCTLQSCAGHRCSQALHCAHCGAYTAGGVGAWPEHAWSGQLWLWLDEVQSRMFHEHALELAAHPLIEKVSVFYHVEGKEIVDIVFKGTDQLDASMTIISQFLRNPSEFNR